MSGPRKNAVMELVKEFNSDKDPDLKFVCLETLPLPDEQK